MQVLVGCHGRGVVVYKWVSEYPDLDPKNGPENEIGNTESQKGQILCSFCALSAVCCCTLYDSWYETGRRKM